MNLWDQDAHALAYLENAGGIPHRTEGESALLELLPQRVTRVCDLGSGDGRLLQLVLARYPDAHAVALDFSPVLLDKLRARFPSPSPIQVVEHSLDHPLPAMGSFDAVVSSFAIHHVNHARKRRLYAEIFRQLSPGAVFCNLEHVASPSPKVHLDFLRTIGIRPEDEDPSNKLLDMETQLGWLSELGFIDVDCFWKWRELALLAGTKPS